MALGPIHISGSHLNEPETVVSSQPYAGVTYFGKLAQTRPAGGPIRCTGYRQNAIQMHLIARQPHPGLLYTTFIADAIAV